MRTSADENYPLRLPARQPAVGMMRAGISGARPAEERDCAALFYE